MAQIALLILAPGEHRELPCRGGRHIEHDRAATDLAVFDVLLLWQGVVDQDGDGLGAQYGQPIVCSLSSGMAMETAKRSAPSGGRGRRFKFSHPDQYFP